MLDIINIIEWLFLLGFLPGFVLIGLFRLKEISWVKGLLYIIGLSLVFDMAVGFGINAICPLFGLIPFTREVMAPIWIGIMVIFTAIAFKYRKQLLEPYKWDDQWKAVSIIYIASVALIYQTSLLTNNLVGSDIHLEYYFANQPIISGFTNMAINVGVNICLPITILIPMFSVLSGLEVMWIFKVIQPLVMAILPVILYKIYKLQFGKTVAIIATIFFITLPFFTMDIAQLIRQQYAMIFFALVTLVLIGRGTGMVTKIILGSIFGIGVAISHYGLGLGFMCYMGVGIIVISILKMKWFQRLWMFISKQQIPVDITSSWKYVITWVAIAVICIGGGLLYYLNVGSGGTFHNTAKIPIAMAQNTVSSVITVTPSTPTNTVITPTPTTPQKVELSNEWINNLNIAAREPLLQTAVGFDFGEATPWGKAWRILLYIVELCLLIGVVRLIFRPPPLIRTEFLVFIITSIFVVLGMYTLPVKGFGLGATRVLILTLTFMCPFFVLGVDTITKGITRLLRIQWKPYFLTIASIIILVPYVLFNSGIVFELIKSTKSDIIDIPFSPLFSGYRLDIATNFSDEDMEAMDWLFKNKEEGYLVFGDYHTGSLVVQHAGENYYDIIRDIDVFCQYKKGYIFLRKWNVDHEMLTYGTSYGCRQSIDWFKYQPWCNPMNHILRDGVVVFDNGAKVIKVR